MILKEKSIARIRLNESEVLGIFAVLDKIKPSEISNFNGERQGLATLREKLTSAYKKLR